MTVGRTSGLLLRITRNAQLHVGEANATANRATAQPITLFACWASVCVSATKKISTFPPALLVFAQSSLLEVQQQHAGAISEAE